MDLIREHIPGSRGGIFDVLPSGSMFLFEMINLSKIRNFTPGATFKPIQFVTTKREFNVFNAICSFFFKLFRVFFGISIKRKFTSFPYVYTSHEVYELIPKRSPKHLGSVYRLQKIIRIHFPDSCWFSRLIIISNRLLNLSDYSTAILFCFCSFFDCIFFLRNVVINVCRITFFLLKILILSGCHDECDWRGIKFTLAPCNTLISLQRKLKLS